MDNHKNLLCFFVDSVTNVLTNEILLENYETRGGALLPQKTMEMFLRLIGDPGFQSGVANDVGVHRTTACKTVNIVTDKIIKKGA